MLLQIKNEEVLTKYTDLWNKIKEMLEETDGKPCDFKRGVIKNNFDSVDDLPLNKTLKLYSITIMFRSVFEEDDKYYPHIYLDECVYKFVAKL